MESVLWAKCHELHFGKKLILHYKNLTDGISSAISFISTNITLVQLFRQVNLRTIASAHNKDSILVVQLRINLSLCYEQKANWKTEPSKHTTGPIGTYISSPLPNVSKLIVLDFLKTILRLILANVCKSTLHNPICCSNMEREWPTKNAFIIR